ncbi:conserved hypothetical protein [Thermosulfidibacter takaii ABI70S6]|uniref:MIP18 family-like domain-containing protein n=1 Tax=Thermosulfidibacter takaii (strain DSM 17441 / JCM 13301 / NBRC 103674 / ABI70S6) TaxID=1298851 RepID=A0A0S3QT40_THET7|nr:hypothetical protein [Thermosulfidibacter takaii]BAT71482.1 conserved hypothetical protein [Thermosulfidibacter takaii ABI70S6]
MKNLPDEKDIIEILKSVKDPETSFSVYELGIVKHIDYIPEERKLLIHVDFKKRLPSCAACVTIAWVVQKGILDALAKEFMKYPGIEVVETREAPN